MAKTSGANGMMQAVEAICALYGVPTLRMQSRMFRVPGEGGRERPMFIGEWRDLQGVKRRKGMADILALPVVQFAGPIGFAGRCPDEIQRMTTPLWVECKFGTGRLGDDQEAFRDWVQATGGDWLLAHNSTEPLEEWFRNFGVTKR